MPSPWRVRRGVVHVDGEARPVVAGDYPYFRDDPASWAPRLAEMRDAGIETVSAYVPWRHHAPRDILREAGPDFDGTTLPSRDVAGFLALARDAGLSVILKPGPFVHGELPYGGLPDYVDPAANPAIEPERGAGGAPFTWGVMRMLAPERRALPAPFGEAFGSYVRAWLRAVARDVIVPFSAPRGPVVALQLLNEGIYCDSASADPAQLGFAVSTLARYRAFLRGKYASIQEYNAAHGTSFDGWSAIDPPRRARLLAETRDLLAYLDWSEFQGRLYSEVAGLYHGWLVEAGVDPAMPVFFNFNPNGGTYRDRPASNDGWYTRVNVPDDAPFAFGSTNWIGVVAGDPLAFRQYLMAVTAFRGPAMEQNWGFSTQYYAPYEFASPSHFESLAALAFGATGMNAYTFAGTRAWRDDANLAGDWVPERTNDHEDESSGDYPGDAAVRSNGERTAKRWALEQLARYVRSEGPRFVAHGPVAPVAWGMYRPYAWVGQWLPRGDPDDVLWRPPLLAIPRGAYHGLDAFVETMTAQGAGFRQVDVARPDADFSGVRVLALSAHEFMDAATQERIASWVEGGGALLLTNLVPDLDERLRPFRGALAERVFPHASSHFERLQDVRPVEWNGERVALAVDFAVPVEPPGDADPFLYFDGRPIGYARRVGRGSACYVGFSPWRARGSGDDAALAAMGQRLVWRLVERLAGGDPRPARPVGAAPGEVVAWQHGDPERDEQHLFVLVREASGTIEVEFARPGGRCASVRLRSPSQSAHAIAIENGRLRACHLKGVNDLRAERVAPRVELAGESCSADDPCDLCVVPRGDGSLDVTVAQLEKPETRVRLGSRAALAVADLSRASARSGLQAESARSRRR